MNFILNNENVSEEANPAITVLDYLRNIKKLTGTKEGCREGDCGACTVIIGTLNKNKIQYKTVNSCLMPIADLNGKHLVTIEGLNRKELNIIQENMVDEGGTQCGFCTPGFIISITNYFLSHADYCLEDAVGSLDGNICRCTGYEGIKRSIKNVITTLESKDQTGLSHIEFLINVKIIPEYFLTIPDRLKRLNKETIIQKKITSKEKYKYLVSGGTDLYVQKWEDLYESKVTFVSEKKDLTEIKKVGKKVVIDGAATIEEVANSKIIQKYFPQIKDSLKLFGSLPIRNRATIAGNIVNASPIADGTNILLALDAEVIITGVKKKRNILLRNLYLGYKKLDLKPGEVIESILIETPPKVFHFNYEKVSRRTYLDIASVNSSIFIEVKNDIIKNINLSAGGVAPIPMYLEKTCSYLINKKIFYEIVREATNIALTEISPISDARGSAVYKSLLLQQLIFAHFIKLFPHLIEPEMLL